MIIWLTSYPKSGNTWVRSFISTILFSVNGENDFSNLGQIRQFPDRIFFKEYVKDFGDVYEVARNWINVQNYLNLDRKIKIFKTHHVNCTIENNPFTNLNNTAGVIHIVRDPRNVVTSIMNHWSLKDINASKELIINENNWLGLKNHENDVRSNQIPTLISSWKTHYNSWKQNSHNYLLIKYEDLISNPIIYFNEITKFVSRVTKLNFNTEKVKKAIETNSFENMKNLEKKGLFKENALNRERNSKVDFFNLGPENDWKKILDKKISSEIENKFNNEMRELKYI